MRKLYLPILGVTLMLTSCTIGALDSSTPLPADDHFIFVIGVSPVDAKIVVDQGEIGNGIFTPDNFSPLTFGGTPDRGYILSRARGNTMQAIISIQMPRDEYGKLRLPVAPCGGVKTPVFTGAAGKVIYVGNVRYSRHGERVEPAYSSDIDSAREFLRANYPALAGRLEQGRYELLPTSLRCAVEYE